MILSLYQNAMHNVSCSFIWLYPVDRNCFVHFSLSGTNHKEWFGLALKTIILCIQVREEYFWLTRIV